MRQCTPPAALVLAAIAAAPIALGAQARPQPGTTLTVEQLQAQAFRRRMSALAATRLTAECHRGMTRRLNRKAP